VLLFEYCVGARLADDFSFVKQQLGGSLLTQIGHNLGYLRNLPGRTAKNPESCRIPWIRSQRPKQYMPRSDVCEKRNARLTRSSAPTNG
jgi:hypothetical protein